MEEAGRGLGFLLASMCDGVIYFMNVSKCPGSFAV